MINLNLYATSTYSDRYDVWTYHSNEITKEYNILLCGTIDSPDDAEIIIYNDDFTRLSYAAQDYVVYRTLFLSAFAKIDHEEMPSDQSLHIMADMYAVMKIGSKNALQGFHDSLDILGVKELSDDLKEREKIMMAL